MVKKILIGIRLFRNKKKESYFALQRILGFFPNHIHYYEEALRHKSSSKEGTGGRYLNNERLEFLGDAILDAVVADIVYHKFRTRNEGFLTNTRSKIVKRESLDYISKRLGLDRLIISSYHVNSQKSHILGNALEAFIGAIYLDKGYETAKDFIIRRMITPYINIDDLARKEVNFKSKLLEWAQKHKVKLEFNLIESYTDGDHNSVFQTQVLLNGVVVGTGSGFSKKESQQQASEMASKKIKSNKALAEEIKELSKPKEPEIIVPEPEEYIQETEITPTPSSSNE